MAIQTLLLIDPDVDSASAVQSALLETCPVLWATTLASGLAHLETCAQEGDRAINAIVCDLHLPDSQGIETFERLAARCPHLPIVVLTAREHQATATAALHLGAQSYLFRDTFEARLFVDIVERVIERAHHATALFEERERAQVTLEAIADGVMTTDEKGIVTYCNPVAKRLTGWAGSDAIGLPFAEVFQLIDAMSVRLPDDPMTRTMRKGAAVSLPPDSRLVRRDGIHTAIEDSAAPIHDRAGKVSGAVIVFRDVTAARAATTKMSYLAQHDVLTGLPNRQLFRDRLRQAIEMAKRHHQMLGVLFLDIDRFKHINDSLGHAAGDRLLQSVAHRLVTSVRGADTVSRQGGDEFVILLPDLKRTADAAVAAEKILQAINLRHHVDRQDLHITASVGVVIYPDDGDDDATILKNADAAMYRAKESGRNAYRFFTPDMNVLAGERLQVESELRAALKHNQFVLHYQPIFNLEQREIVAVEALVRWQHPERGLLHPRSFMKIAEQCGFVVPMGHWVVREACRQAQTWREAGFPSLRMAVNSSALELRTTGFAQSVREALDESRLAPDALEIEITEAFLLHESGTTTAILDAIAGMGIRLALDDFGTGYSSLNHLRRFPIDTLKIDRSFIRHLVSDRSDAGIVRAMILLGRSLDLSVVAEGVETKAQAALLQAEGCPAVQGHYFGQAVDPERLAGMLRREPVAAAS